MKNLKIAIATLAASWTLLACSTNPNMSTGTSAVTSTVDPYAHRTFTDSLKAACGPTSLLKCEEEWKYTYTCLEAKRPKLLKRTPRLPVYLARTLRHEFTSGSIYNKENGDCPRTGYYEAFNGVLVYRSVGAPAPNQVAIK